MNPYTNNSTTLYGPDLRIYFEDLSAVNKFFNSKNYLLIEKN